MIIILESGRLGNQLFQVNYMLEHLKKKEVLILIGFKQFSKIFEHNKKIKIIKNNLLYKFLKFFENSILGFFKFIHLIKLIYEDENANIIIRNGLINIITYSSSSSFQFEIKNSKITEYIYFKKELIFLARNKINNLKKRYDKIFFVHIRLGDYLHWPSKLNPAYINNNWYKENIYFIKKKYPNSCFIICSDEIDIIKKDINYKYCLFSNNNYAFDFVMMANCDGGILSASSFSWWAANYISKFSNLNSIELIGPKYWIGHTNKNWFPKKIKTSFIEYIDVKK